MKTFLSLFTSILFLSAPVAAETTYLEPTACDLIASHPDDPDRNAPGRERSEIDLPAAEAACLKVVMSGALDARAHYLLGRVLFYQEKYQEGAAHVGHAASMGYRQAVFVYGLIQAMGAGGEPDFCKAGKQFRQAVSLEHPWSGYYYVEHALDGNFDECDFTVTDAQLKDALHMAATQVTSAASGGRIEALQERLAAKLEASE